MRYEKMWLDYKNINDKTNEKYLKCILYVSDTEPCQIIKNAAEELKLAAKGMYAKEVDFVCNTMKDMAEAGIIFNLTSEYGEEGYCITVSDSAVNLYGAPKGILYAVFRTLTMIGMNKLHSGYREQKTPSNPLRFINHWDNMDGSIERGYSGNSFFFEDTEFILNDRTIMYARLLASIGINSVVINNVNVVKSATELITKKYRSKLVQISEIFASYGVRLYLSINFAAPMELGDLDTADPLDPRVREWWKAVTKELFSEVPNFGGYLIKADSEGRPGPFTYERTHADGANMFADATEPYGGLVVWRCFVYNCRQDWRDKKTDRACACYDTFKPLDGEFKSNVILQIKNGPMDFQVREPVTPLFGAMPHTNQILEVQIAQEYTGQQKHVCYLIPMFKEILSFKTYCSEFDTVCDIVSGKTYSYANCGMAAVTNTGNDANWTGHPFAAVNLYGFGRLSFDTSLTAEEIAEEWICMTYGCDPEIICNITKLLMMSWPAYEKYTSPLGVGWMIAPNHHYGPDVDGYEYSFWGTYHRADTKGIGVDRSSKGTGYAAQYFTPNAKLYESPETCPEELLLFFHNMPYGYRLSSGKTLIQHIYDSHFDGVTDVMQMIELWKTLEHKISEEKYADVVKRLDYQLWHSKEWRDVICSYFYRKTGIEDEQKRKIY